MLTFDSELVSAKKKQRLQRKALEAERAAPPTDEVAADLGRLQFLGLEPCVTHSQAREFSCPCHVRVTSGSW
eukprot:13166992-Alexandrium_andersonii.AAC.1